MSADSADWALLVLPAIEGAIRFRVPGAIASWLVLAGGYWGANMASSPSLPAATDRPAAHGRAARRAPGRLPRRAPRGRDRRHRRGRAHAEERSLLLRAAALGGWRTSRFDVDEILDVIRRHGRRDGLRRAPGVRADRAQQRRGRGRPRARRPRAEVRPLDDAAHVDIALDERLLLSASPVPGSALQPAIAAGDPRLRAAAAVRATGNTTFVPLDPDGPAPATLLALPLATIDDHTVVHHDGVDRSRRTARCPGRESRALRHPGRCVVAQRPGAPPARGSQGPSRSRGLARPADRARQPAAFHRGAEPHSPPRAPRRPGRSALPRPRRVQGRERPLRPRRRQRPARGGRRTGCATCVRPGDLVARIGGDEFTIMLTRFENVAPAAAVGERICARLSEPFRLGAREIRISTSVGIALAPADAADASRPAAPSRRRDVSRQVEWQSALDDGPRLTRIGLTPSAGRAPNSSRRRGLRPKKPLKLGLISTLRRSGTCHDASRTSQHRMEEM